MCDRMNGHEPTDGRQPSIDLPGLGVRGAFGYKGPRFDEMSDEELDIYAEVMYNRSLETFAAIAAVERRRPRKRRRVDYTTKNCEEALGSPEAAAHVADVESRRGECDDPRGSVGGESDYERSVAYLVRARRYRGLHS